MNAATRSDHTRCDGYGYGTYDVHKTICDIPPAYTRLLRVDYAAHRPNDEQRRRCTNLTVGRFTTRLFTIDEQRPCCRPPAVRRRDSHTTSLARSRQGHTQYQRYNTRCILLFAGTARDKRSMAYTDYEQISRRSPIFVR